MPVRAPLGALVATAACAGAPSAPATATGAAPTADDRPDGRSWRDQPAPAFPDPTGRTALRAPAPPPATDGPAPGTYDAYFVGRWIAVDDDDWEYHLEVSRDMRFTEEIERPDYDDCVQHGKIWVRGSDLHWYYDVNTCNELYERQSDPDPIVAATAAGFTLDLGDYTLTYLRLE